MRKRKYIQLIQELFNMVFLYFYKIFNFFTISFILIAYVFDIFISFTLLYGKQRQILIKDIS